MMNLMDFGEALSNPSSVTMRLSFLVMLEMSLYIRWIAVFGTDIHVSLRLNCNLLGDHSD